MMEEGITTNTTKINKLQWECMVIFRMFKVIYEFTQLSRSSSRALLNW